MLIKLFSVICLIFAFTASAQNHKNRYDLAQMTNNFVSLVHSVEQFKSVEENHYVDFQNEYNSLNYLNKTVLVISELLNGYSSSKCVQDLLYIAESLYHQELWPMRMLDSFGKPESGFLTGNLRWLGSYQECLDVYAPPKPNSSTGDFHGQYCSAELSVELFNKTVPIVFGICLPDSCDTTNYTKSAPAPFMQNAPELDHVQYSYFNTPNISLLSCQPKTKPFTSAAIWMITILSILVFVALVGSFLTVFEYLAKRDDPPCVSADVERSSVNGLSVKDHSSFEEIQTQDQRGSRQAPAWVKTCTDVLNCFCIFTNGSKLLDTSQTEGQLLCLHGIRFLSMCWVVVCHTYGFFVNAVHNIADITTIADNWPFQIILNGFYSVDSFFLLSGFLLAYLFFQESAKKDVKVNWLYFYIHRYMRLTPVYMLMLGTYAALIYYMGDGPMWIQDRVDKSCKEGWWYNILYINNFSSKSKCIGWSWYLANDMQFFVISPLFLITLRKWPKVGFSMVGLFFLTHFATNFGITYHYELNPGLGDLRAIKDPIAFIARWQEYFDKIYARPYCRIGPYLVGILLAYHLVQRQQTNRGKDSKWFLAIGWMVSTGVTLACVFGLYHRTMGVVESSFYNSTSRICYGLGLGWVIYTCLTGQAGVINSILSFKLFIPLSRLTYCAYLIHPIVMLVYFQSLRTSLYFSHPTAVFTYLGLLVVSYVFAFFTSVLFESPIIRLEKIIRKKFSGRS